jgi:hypothetical protein
MDAASGTPGDSLEVLLERRNLAMLRSISLKVAGRLARPATLAYSGMPRHEISRASNAGLLDQCGSLADTRDSRQTDGNDLPDRATIPARILLRP